MNINLQIALILLSIIFFIVITYFLKKKHLNLRQSLVWYFAALVFVCISVFPKILEFIANAFGIVEKTNAAFLVVIAFLLLITFLDNITLSKNKESINNLIREISLLKSKIEEDSKKEKHD
jgi:hypothetical protein